MAEQKLSPIASMKVNTSLHPPETGSSITTGNKLLTER